MEIKSPFLKLSGELRNRIYELVAAVDEPVDITYSGKDAMDVENGVYAGLTRVCRQIRKEYLPIHRQYARVTVRHHSDLEKWTQSHCNLVQEVNVRISIQDWTSWSSINWVPVMRARAISLSSQATFNTPFRVQVHYIYQQQAFFWSISVVYQKVIEKFQEILDQQSGPLMSLLREEPCSLKQIHFCVASITIVLSFGPKPEHSYTTDVEPVLMFVRELGFRDCSLYRSKYNINTGNWSLSLRPY